MQCHCDGGMFYFNRHTRCFVEVASDVLVNIKMIYESEIIRSSSILLKSIKELYIKHSKRPYSARNYIPCI